MGYEPEYSNNEILVKLKDRYNTEGFAIGLGEGLGYSFLRHHEQTDSYVFSTNLGETDAAVNSFLGKKEFVDWAEPRDLKLEKRIDGLEIIVAMVNDLIDGASIPDREYYGRINAIIKNLREL